MRGKNIIYIPFALFLFPIISLILPCFVNDTYNIMPANIWEYVLNTVIATVGTVTIAGGLGIILATVISFYDFYGRSIVRYILVFPLAVPMYISALSYGYFIDNALFSDYCVLCAVHPLILYMFVMGAGLYPYVYIVTLAKMELNCTTILISKILGRGHFFSLVKIVLPLCLPASLMGMMLVAMEVMSDFATAQIFGLNTCATVIYRSWFLLRDYVLAGHIILWMLVCVLFLFIFTKKVIYARDYKCMTFDFDRQFVFKNIPGTKGIILLLCVLIGPILGFMIPLIPLVMWAVQYSSSVYSIKEFLVCVYNSFSVSFIAAFITVMMALFFCCIMRIDGYIRWFARCVSIGYAVPSMVVAFGIISALAMFAKAIMWILQQVSINVQISMIGTTFAIIYAYSFRFLAIPMSAIETSLRKVPMEYDWFSSIVGKRKFKTYFTVHIPMISRAVIYSFLLVFLDSVKELTSTLIIRPFKFDTIAIKVYDLITEERYIDASVPALVLVLLGLISVLIISYFGTNKDLHSTLISDRLEDGRI
ncbi:MAG: binding--dependent transport system inner membrane component family protein [Candidatus Xenolissoclinum pacificiensis L6]|uniref:Binding--dependent transport system inner membrane component family protein n=1 Tax=Candidatus Xenolissoclinum pacificiensis L6 TaxID=1401685 RepID=W2V0Q8_9RICK|nr:MAG: binding--dependent transport system inner membrane component family protein [Candidatus Xenolissoclinum pacificiensis L6]